MARTWLFQANPTRFDVDAFAASSPAEAEWLVSRYADKIAPGDRAYLWRSGGAKGDGGVFAETEVVSSVRTVADDGPANLWASPAEAQEPRPRVRVVIKRVANKREVVRRDWWKVDPVLKDHLIMRMANHTTFAIDEPHRSRLDHLWSRTGTDWTYADSVAGLYAFLETYGDKVSKLPGSPTADVSILIGRPIPGVYNKVMNFRSLDPQDERAGFDGASAQDKLVWAQFYEPGAGLRTQEVRNEFERLWRPAELSGDELSAREALDAESERLASTLSLQELMARWAQRQARRPAKPRVGLGRARVYERDPIVAAIARKRSDFRCEVPDCSMPLFVDRDGVRFVEVHHIRTLATGGDDTPENVVCLCPAHHREAHFGREAQVLASILSQVRGSKGQES